MDTQEPKSITVRDPYGNAEVQFPVGRLPLSWAKEGYFDVCLCRVGMGYVHEIAIGFGYGHQTVAIGGVSVSFNSTGSVGVGISFSSNMEEMFYGAATCTSSGKMTWY